MSKQKTFRYFSCVLYPDDSKITNQFQILNEFYIYCYILHDKDLDSNGNLKKPHYHVVLSLPNNSPTNCKSICDRLQISHVEGVTSIRSYCRYLVHADDLDKYQYNKFDIQGSSVMVARAKSYLASDLNSNILDVLNLLDSIDGPVTYSSFLRMCANSQISGTLRNVKVLTLLNEHNEKYMNGIKYND